MLDLDESIEDLIREINTTVDDIRSQPLPEKSTVGSTLDLLIAGIPDIGALTTLFSAKLDDIMGTIFKYIENGDIDKAIQAMNKLVDLLGKIGIGKGTFKGPISKTVITTIIDSVKSPKYAMIKSNISKSLTTYKRMNYVLKELKRKTKTFSDRAQRKKYKDAVYALKRALKICIKIYKNRKLVSSRVIKGLKNIVTEDVIVIERVQPIE